MIHKLKQKSGAIGFVSILGKSTLASESPEFLFTAAATQYVMEQGYGIIHGGYAGGAMSAASDAAQAYIKKYALPAERNIGVPQRQHDGLWKRVEGAVFTDPADDIYDRLRLVTGGDIAVIAPLGGDGTELEVATLLHENIIRASQAANCQGQRIIPVLFLQTSDGTDWKKLLQTKMSLLATSYSTFEKCPWILFASSLDEFRVCFAKARMI